MRQGQTPATALKLILCSHRTLTAAHVVVTALSLVRKMRHCSGFFDGLLAEDVAQDLCKIKGSGSVIYCMGENTESREGAIVYLASSTLWNAINDAYLTIYDFVFSEALLQ